MSRVLPILFNTEMVRAVLDGKKMVNRRIIKFPKNRFTEEIPKADKLKVYKNTRLADKISFHEEPHYVFDIKPPYQPGDILYVRETWNKLPHSGEYIYKASGCGNENIPKGEIGHIKWRPSIHMPKAAARIWLKVTDVRAERLWNITEEQAKKEGAVRCYEELRPDEDTPVIYRSEDEGGYYALGFKAIWNSTIKKPDMEKYGWDANPWVWVIEFERCGKPESEV